MFQHQFISVCFGYSHLWDLFALTFFYRLSPSTDYRCSSRCTVGGFNPWWCLLHTRTGLVEGEISGLRSSDDDSWAAQNSEPCPGMTAKMCLLARTLNLWLIHQLFSPHSCDIQSSLSTHKVLLDPENIQRVLPAHSDVLLQIGLINKLFSVYIIVVIPGLCSDL